MPVNGVDICNCCNAKACLVPQKLNPEAAAKEKNWRRVNDAPTLVLFLLEKAIFYYYSHAGSAGQKCSERHGLCRVEGQAVTDSIGCPSATAVPQAARSDRSCTLRRGQVDAAK